MNYFGEFTGMNGKIYQVHIIKDEASTPKEILLAGDSPFVVRYNNSNTPFDGIRTSTATISVVHNTYLEDVLPTKARETMVFLRENSTTVWMGYLTPKVYNQSYTNEYETIELEAADCLSTTQYIPYKTESKGLKSFKEIIGSIIDETNMEGFVWPGTRRVNDKQVYPDELMISDANFYSNDSDEPWNTQEVIEEMCKYMGFTAIQKGLYLYFMDYGYLSKNPGIPFTRYNKTSDYAQGSTSILGKVNTITQDNITGPGQDVSFEPIYNKIIVKDSFYEAEDFIGNLFDDNYLTNRNGDFYASISIPAPPPGHYNKPQYPWGSSFFDQKFVDDADDSKYLFWHRLYDHRDFESVYRDRTSLDEMTFGDLFKKDEYITREYVGGTILDLGRVKKEYVDEDTNQTIVANKIEWERYLCIAQKENGWGWENYGYGQKINDKMVIFRLKPGYRSKVVLSDDNYLVINYSMLFTKYDKRNYINPDWTTRTYKKSWMTGGDSWGEAFGNLAFRVGFGNKYWNGKEWQNGKTTFIIPCVMAEDDYAYIMEEKKVLNNVGWELDIHEEGYKIPLKGVNTTEEITFEIFLPRLQLLTDFKSVGDLEYNQYCWIKDFSIKLTKEGQDKEVEEADIVYENVIDENEKEIEVNEMDEIELKFTTSVPGTKPSYSDVVYYNKTTNTPTTLSTMYDPSISQTMTPEENIIARYHKQYSTPTKRLNYTFGVNLPFYDVYKNMDIENPEARYVQLGSEIDYKMNQQIMELVELK